MLDTTSGHRAGLAQKKLSPIEAMEIAESMIKRARAEMAMRQEQGFVKLP